jgi:glycosyltransferase involved in cell wall biosynthesis
MKLSVVIRARNEARSLRRVFAALQAQRFHSPWEIIVVDNESEDETREVCVQYRVRIVTLPRHEFTYGRALNLGIGQARGAFVLLLSAHSLPIGPNFLESALAPFADPQMAAVRCLYVGNLDQLESWYEPRDIQYGSPAEQQAAESGLEWTRRYPTATCCVIRRSVWERINYDEELEANEDKLWASEVLALGYKMRCCADATYTYTRRRDKQDVRRRNYREFRALYRISGYVPLKWHQFVAGVGKALIDAPVIGLRHAVDTIIWKANLVTIPWQTKLSPRHGSLKEYDKHV